MFSSVHRWFKVAAASEGRLTISRVDRKMVTPQRRYVRQFKMPKDRAWLTTFNVLSLADSGAGSPRAAIVANGRTQSSDILIVIATVLTWVSLAQISFAGTV